MEESDISQCRYICAAQNMSDNASRGLSVEQLLRRIGWLEGPDLLKMTEEKWPSERSESELVSDKGQEGPLCE